MAADGEKSLRTGQVVDGRYQLLELIDSGGQGNVYKGRDLQDGDLVAIKVLKSQFTNDQHWRERMFREARALSLLSSTQAVRIFDQRWTEDGALCLVMELLKGSDLGQRLAYLEGQGKRLDRELLLRLLQPIVTTLEVAHKNDILHRDLKPANIFVCDDGSVRLIDFGFAKFTTLKGMTEYGQIAGSPSYLAPECWKGKSELLDQRIDVYGLAAVIFRCLAGRAPFVGDALEIHRLATTAARPSLHALRPDLPASVDPWVDRALAIEPDQRFESVISMWQGFKQATAAKPTA